MDPKSRLKEFVKYKQISNNQFTQKIGLANGYLTGLGQVSSENLAKAQEFYPELNLEWVITGKGYMIKPNKEKPSHDYPLIEEKSIIDKLNRYCEKHPELEILIDLLKNQMESDRNLIRSLTIVVESKDAIINNLQKEIHDLRSQLADNNK